MSRAEGADGADGSDPDGGAANRDRPTGTDVLVRLDGADCTMPDCAGKLERRPFKGTDAVVCDDCDTPPVRVWDDD